MKQKKSKTKPRIEQLDINLIRPYWRNPRSTDEAVGFVAASISRYGFNVPIIIDANGVIVAGHVRYRAARELNLETVPVIRVDLSESRARQFRIADNKTAEMAKWNPDMLASELMALNDLDNVRRLFGGALWDDLLKLPSPSMSFDTDEPDAPGYDGSQYEVICPHCGKENIVRPEAATAQNNNADGL